MVGVAVVFHRRAPHVPVSSGRLLTPAGAHVGVGSFPCNMISSPDGRYLVVTDAGYREQLTVIDTATGSPTDHVDFVGSRNDPDGIYYGLAFGREEGSAVLYASRGNLGIVSRFRLTDDGKLARLDGDLVVPEADRIGPVAGVAFDATRGHVVVALNGATSDGDHHGLVAIFDAATRQELATVNVRGYPLDVAAVNGRVFVTSERDGTVVPIDGEAARKPIKTGANPTRLTASSDGKTLYVANSGSDTISEIDPIHDVLRRTLLLRPNSMRNLPISTPLFVGVGDRKLYVACADLNAVAVVDSKSGKMEGLIPTGWYPTAVALQGGALYVSSAKGVQARNPNDKPAGPSGAWGKYPPNIIEGTVSKIDLSCADSNLTRLTVAVLENDRLRFKPRLLKNPGITHVIYVIKENRTYDQVFGDIAEGNGDPGIVMFGEEVTPNQHALAKRFGLYDNFYDCAEVSADGWNWSTSGMINEYTARNVPGNYSGRRPNYDFEGTNGSNAPDLEGLNDVAAAPGGYLWDDAARHHTSFRNYGFFVRGMRVMRGEPAQMESLKKVLQGHTDSSYPQFDLSIADSDLWQKLGKTGRGQKREFGKFNEPSRFDEWEREFDGFVASGRMPSLQFLRLPRDHTAGTAAGQWSPRAMVADNDYAVGKLVEAVSHSPFWKSTIICILEDDAQNGFDHVDCHRSTALLVSPFMARAGHDSRFYNTDSMLRTIELVLGLPPMNGFDATADPMAGFLSEADNAEPFQAVMPSAAVGGEINSASAYRARDSSRLLSLTHEDSAADLQLNDILWGALMAHRPKPPIHGIATRDLDDR